MRIGAAFIVLLLVVTIASGLGVVYARQKHRQLFIEINGLQRERDDLNIEFGRLQLEQATWAETNRIEQVARGQLGMVSPGAANTILVKR